MNITPEDLQQIAFKLGLLGMEKAVLEREKQELTVALEAAETRLEEMGNPSSLVTKDSN